ncbi:unnamed protein product [Zymoseptoria tritici ST99CH_3D1]|nr:unnamed protein product [Zymoseptoria tritici ST99CH_3D1]
MADAPAEIDLSKFNGSEQWLALHKIASDAGFPLPGGQNDLPILTLQQAHLDLDDKNGLHSLTTEWHRAKAAARAVNPAQWQAPDERDFEAFQSYIRNKEVDFRAASELNRRTTALHRHLFPQRAKPCVANVLNYLESLYRGSLAPLNAHGLLRARYYELAARRGRAELGPDWVAGRKLGEGTYGEAFLWLKQDHLGAIVDRLVIKTSEYGSQINFTADGTPTEVEAMLRLQKIPEASHSIVKLRNWAIDRTQTIRRYRLYMEMCPFGNLYDFAQKYLSTQTTVRTFVAEPFAWSVFYNLVKAGILMERGNPEQAVEGWELIVHRDLKSPNVFFSTNTSGEFMGYQSAKIGDFGISVFPKPEVPTSRYAFFLKNATLAPEVCTTNLRGVAEEIRVSTKTNVWGVGSIMRSLLTGGGMDVRYSETYDPITKFITTEDVRPFARLPSGPRYATNYSENLLNLITRCQARLPQDRPSFDQLLEHINWFTDGANGFAEDHSKGLRFAPLGDDQYRRFPVKTNTDDSFIGAMLRNVTIPGPRPAPPKPRIKRERTDGDDSSSDSSLGGPPGRSADLAKLEERQARAAALAARNPAGPPARNPAVPPARKPARPPAAANTNRANQPEPGSKRRRVSTAEAGAAASARPDAPNPPPAPRPQIRRPGAEMLDIIANGTARRDRAPARPQDEPLRPSTFRGMNYPDSTSRVGAPDPTAAGLIAAVGRGAANVQARQVQALDRMQARPFGEPNAVSRRPVPYTDARTVNPPTTSASGAGGSVSGLLGDVGLNSPQRPVPSPLTPPGVQRGTASRPTANRTDSSSRAGAGQSVQDAIELTGDTPPRRGPTRRSAPSRGVRRSTPPRDREEDEQR